MFPPRDNGEPMIAHDTTWKADSEPPLVPTDSWARGSVPTRKKQIAQTESGASTRY